MSSTNKLKDFLSKFFKGLQESWIILGIVLILLIIVDVMLGFTVGLLEDKTAGLKTPAEICGNTSWCKQYYKDHNDSVKLQWVSYTYWRREPFKSQYINVSKDGLRNTWNKEYSRDDKVLKIFVFGGSTTWGSGARDDYTIPSYISKILAENNLKAEVTNFGETGYVNTQETISLLRELEKGNIPDIVVFYDGVNDVYSTFQSGKAGIPLNEINRDLGMKLVLDKKALYKHTFSTLLDSTGTYRFARYIKHAVNKKKTTFPANDSKELVDETINVYETNIKIIEDAGKRYGFKTLFYWQPMVFFKDPQTSVEKEEAQKEKDSISIFKKVYEGIKSSNQLNDDPNFHNLTTIFNDSDKEFFTDFCHITEDGNKIIAKKIAMNILTLADQSKKINSD